MNEEQKKRWDWKQGKLAQLGIQWLTTFCFSTWMEVREGETFSEWRDRTYYDANHPTWMSKDELYDLTRNSLKERFEERLSECKS